MQKARTVIVGTPSRPPLVTVLDTGTNVASVCPAGYNTRKIRIWGGGGGGSIDATNGVGFGGNSGAYADRTDTVNAGDTILITVGTGGASKPATPDADGNPGTATTINSPAMTANGGTGGLNAGTAGTAATASGGTTNTPGNVSSGAPGKGAPNGGADASAGGGSIPGGGGSANYTGITAGKAGAAGRAEITYSLV